MPHSVAAVSDGEVTRPRLVLVHGTRFDTSQWRGYAELIPEAEVTPVDLPGHGTREGSGFTLDMALEVIGAAVEGARDRPVALGGHSLGGYLAATYAERYPDALNALALMGAMGDPAAHPVLLNLYTGYPRWVQRFGAERMADVANRTIAKLGVTAEDQPGSVGYDVLEDAWKAVVDTCGPHQLRGLRMPVWLVTGSLDQLGIDLRAYREAAPNTRSVVLPGATHVFPVTHREQTAAVLARMVREMPRGERQWHPDRENAADSRG